MRAVEELRAVAAAITFQTRLPLGRRIAVGGDDVARSGVAFPLVGAGVGAAVGGVAVALRLERRRHPATAPELAELERALRRTGRDPRPPTTLLDLERLLGPDERTTGYLRAVRAARYDGAPGAPTRAQRRALRLALGDGLGIRGRLRALWGLPPRPRLH